MKIVKNMIVCGFLLYKSQQSYYYLIGIAEMLLKREHVLALLGCLNGSYSGLKSLGITHLEEG